ncbi:hypothetical protein F5X98DRAFT_33306 [Xylaria grammica]|nr:hypothetical protein F5X98DRAFT_33306 [Xylaria grammica]
MSLIAEIRRKVHETSRSSSLEGRPPRRCRSAPSRVREDWVVRRELYVPGKKHARSISMNLCKRHRHGRSRVAKACRPDPAVEEEGDYNSDEEDGRNGVPIIYSENRCIPFRASMKYELEAQFQDFKPYADGLSAILREWEPRYKELRRAVLGPLGRDWAMSQWEEFFILENEFFNLRDELYTIEDRMQNVNAQMLLFFDHRHPPPCDGPWYHGGDSPFLSVGGETGNGARKGWYPRLEWNGVDYNSPDRPCPY